MGPLVLSASGRNQRRPARPSSIFAHRRALGAIEIAEQLAALPALGRSLLERFHLIQGRRPAGLSVILTRPRATGGGSSACDSLALPEGAAPLLNARLDAGQSLRRRHSAMGHDELHRRAPGTRRS